VGMALAVVLAVAGAGAMIAGPLQTGLDPKAHAYSAIVWLLAIWAAFHVIVGAVMLLYCIARRMAQRLTSKHDIDIWNVTLYWHFVAVTIVITVAVIGGFPLVK